MMYIPWRARGPVLVRANPNSTQANNRGTSNVRSRRNANPVGEPKELPSLERFTFQDIFASLDPEVKKSVDSIGEIYGRHKMSLADQHASHLPPHTDLDIMAIQTSASEAPDDTSVHRLEPVQEAAPHDKRSQCLNLAGTSYHGRSDLSSSPLAATSLAVTYRTSPLPISEVQNAQMHGTTSSEDGHSSSLSHIASWLRHLHSRHNDATTTNDADTRSSATVSLRRVLGNA